MNSSQIESLNQRNHEMVDTTIILTKGNMAHGQICNCHECPLALAINRHLKQGYFAVVSYTEYSIQHWDGCRIIEIGFSDMPRKGRRIVPDIDTGKEIKIPCRIKIPLPKGALRTTRQTPRILPLP